MNEWLGVGGGITMRKMSLVLGGGIPHGKQPVGNEGEEEAAGDPGVDGLHLQQQPCVAGEPWR